MCPRNSTLSDGVSQETKDYVLTESEEWTPDDVFTSWHDIHH